MKINLFSIPLDNVDGLEEKLEAAGMTSVHSATVDEWEAEFFFSKDPEPVDIPWVDEFKKELSLLEPKPRNTLYFGAYIWQSNEACFALSFGKAHFYLREFCDSDFGLNMARRIGIRGDVRQKAARRYASRRKRGISSYQRDTGLDLESGESIDFLQTGTSNSILWGVSGRFGSSMLVAPDVQPGAIPDFLRRTLSELAKEPLFDLPRTEKVVAKESIEQFDRQLVQEILGDSIDFEQSSHQLIGVDFVFGGQEHYCFKKRRAESPIYSDLSVEGLRKFISTFNIRPDDVLDIKVKTFREDSTSHSVDLKKSLDFSIEHEKVFLQNGQWVRFNEIYIDWLNRSVDDIEIDDSFDTDLRVIDAIEDDFNKEMARERGYELADKNLNLVKVEGHKVEAWDLRKGDTAYAVKFGTTKDLNYVCDQAVNLLELFRNDPAIRENLGIDTYCLWLGFELAKAPSRLSTLGSIIFKQKLDEWARKCRELGIKPQVRISRRLKKPKQQSS